ncbi:MAG: Uma2 family endonuclease [Pseudonocardiaceae bacterium]
MTSGRINWRRESGVDVDLELAPRGNPGFVRRPDLVVVHRAALERVRRDGGILRACAALVVVEIVSPGSHRTDYVIKHGEYAAAGIPYYFAVEFGYQDAGPVTGHFVATEPFPASLRWDGLLAH